TYSRHLGELEAAGAVLVFRRATGEGWNGGHAFYREPSLEPMLGPVALEQPSRVPGTLTPRRPDVTVRRKGSELVRTSRSGSRGGRQPAIPRELARDERGRFTVAPGRESTRMATEPNRDSGAVQAAISRGAEVDPTKETPLGERDPARSVTFIRTQGI